MVISVKFCFYWNKEINYHICCTTSAIDFFNESIPVVERTTIFRDIRNLMTSHNTLKIMEIILFQRNFEYPKNHVFQWLRKKRRVKCNIVEGYIAEHSCKFFRQYFKFFSVLSQEIGFFTQWQQRIVPCLATNSFFKTKKKYELGQKYCQSSCVLLFLT